MRAHRRCNGGDRSLEILKEAIEGVGDAKDRRTSECMVVLVAAREVGTDVDRLVAHTGYPREFIEIISRRMRRARLWVGEFVDDREWWDEHGDLTSGLFAHALVAQGQLIRVGTEGGGCRYLDRETGEVARKWSPTVEAGKELHRTSMPRART